MAAIGPYSRPSDGQHVLPRHHAIARPLRRAADVHVFDESHFGADPLRVFEERHQFVVVRAADDHRVELDVSKYLTASSMPASTCAQRIEPRERLKAIGTQRVEADRQTVQSARCGSVRACSASITPLVVSARSRIAGLSRNHPDQLGQVAAQQRLAAGEADAIDARRARTHRRACSSPRTAGCRDAAATHTRLRACSSCSADCIGR